MLHLRCNFNNNYFNNYFAKQGNAQVINELGKFGKYESHENYRPQEDSVMNFSENWQHTRAIEKKESIMSTFCKQK